MTPAEVRQKHGPRHPALAAADLMTAMTRGVVARRTATMRGLEEWDSRQRREHEAQRTAKGLGPALQPGDLQPGQPRWEKQCLGVTDTVRYSVSSSFTETYARRHAAGRRVFEHPTACPTPHSGMTVSRLPRRCPNLTP